MTSKEPDGGPISLPKDNSMASYASYVPHDLKYSSDFEDSLIQIVLNSTPNHDGIRILPEDSHEQSIEGQSVRTADVILHSLPSISENELPLLLDDTRRLYQSPIPGIRLTHPGGYLEGGSGLDPEMDTFPDDFMANHPFVSTPGQLRAAIQKEIETSVEQLKVRLRARQKAKEKNEQIERELKALTDQHSMELRTLNRMQEERERKREAKEKRKAERKEGG